MNDLILQLNAVRTCLKSSKKAKAAQDGETKAVISEDRVVATVEVAMAIVEAVAAEAAVEATEEAVAMVVMIIAQAEVEVAEVAGTRNEAIIQVVTIPAIRPGEPNKVLLATITHVNTNKKSRAEVASVLVEAIQLHTKAHLLPIQLHSHI